MATGDRTEKRFIGPTALSTSNTNIGFPSTGFQWTTKQFVFTNTGGTEALIYVAIGSAATASNRVLSALPIAGNDVVVWDTALVVETGESLYAYADRSGVNVTVMGWEKQI